MLRLVLLAFVVAVVGAAPSALAQQQRVHQLRSQAAALPPGTLDWFANQCELVDALLDCDVAAALAEAVTLHRAAGAGAPRGAAATAAALAALAAVRRDGAVAAQPWLERSQNLPQDTPDRLRAYHHFARARCLCLLGDHAKELEWSVPGQAAAERVGDPLLRLRGTLVTLHATSRRGLPTLQRALQEAAATDTTGAVAFVRPWLLAEEFQALPVAERDRRGEALLTQLEALAREQGNLRALGIALAFRGNAKAMREDVAGAIAALDAAREVFDRLGDGIERIQSRDILAFCELRRGDLAAAERWLQAAEQLVAGRGLDSLEQEVLRSRLELALRRRDGDAAGALADELRRRSEATRDSEQRVRDARANLERAEERRAAAEAAMLAEQQQREQQLLRSRVQLGGLALAALALLTGLGWHGRARLRRANAALAEQVRAVEAARATQARLEERLRQVERTEGLRTLAAGIAHDFNNLLTTILGNAEQLRARLLRDEDRELLDDATAASRQAARLCRQLQTYAGGEPPAGAPTDLRELASDLLPVLRASMHGAVELQTPTAGDGVAGRIDRVQFEQVLLNLVVNARDAKAHRVTIGLERADHAPGLPGAAAVIHVRDDGEGMTPEVAQRIFDPFFTTRFPGRGLGLAVVHGIVRRHGGTIAVASTPGQGSTFTIHLPLADQAPVPPAAPAAEPVVAVPVAPRAEATVLVVDDDAAVLRVLGQMLQGLGAAVHTATDGPALLRRLADVPTRHRVVVLADLGMPGMDGQEVLRRAAALRPDARRALVSGHPAAYVEQIAQAVGADRVLTKPLQREQLRATVVELLAAAAPAATAAPGR